MEFVFLLLTRQAYKCLSCRVTFGKGIVTKVLIERTMAGETIPVWRLKCLLTLAAFSY